MGEEIKKKREGGKFETQNDRKKKPAGHNKSLFSWTVLIEPKIILKNGGRKCRRRWQYIYKFSSHVCVWVINFYMYNTRQLKKKNLSNNNSKKIWGEWRVGLASKSVSNGIVFFFNLTRILHERFFKDDVCVSGKPLKTAWADRNWTPLSDELER